MTDLCRRRSCNHPKEAHAHFPKGLRDGLVYTWCSACPPGACEKWLRWRPAVPGWLR